MGVDYYAHAVIGCAVLVESLYRKEQVPHVCRKTKKERKVDSAYCPDCGQPAMEEEDVPLFDEDDNRLGIYEIVWSTDHQEAVVGFGVMADENTECVFSPLPNMTTLVEDLAKTLTPLGLWDGRKFGLYAVQECSY